MLVIKLQYVSGYMYIFPLLYAINYLMFYAGFMKWTQSLTMATMRGTVINVHCPIMRDQSEELKLTSSVYVSKSASSR